MIRLRDLFLVMTAFGGIFFGVMVPGWAKMCSPLVLYALMGILFLTFLDLNFRVLFRLSREDILEVAIWSAIKLMVLPILLWILARLTVPEWALPVLLLGGASAGVLAPFFASILGSDVHRPLQIVVVTSLLIPLTLPLLVEVFLGHQLTIPFNRMFRLLCLMIFAPLAAVPMARRLVPQVLDQVRRARFPLLLALIFLCNAGVFAPFSGFLRSQVGQALAALGLSSAVALISTAAGLAIGHLGGRLLNGATGAIILTFVNSMLIIVFASHFFGPRAPLLSAAYTLPFFFMIFPLRWAVRRLNVGADARKGFNPRT
jgi:bile acid:Na+ symporter, BASS family